MFALYENPRAGMLHGRPVAVLGALIETKGQEVWDKRVRFLVTDKDGKNVQVLTDFDSSALGYYVGAS